MDEDVTWNTMSGQNNVRRRQSVQDPYSSHRRSRFRDETPPPSLCDRRKRALEQYDHWLSAYRLEVIKPGEDYPKPVETKASGIGEGLSYLAAHTAEGYGY